jgi:isopentenyl-diphosphate delta-isomerase
MVQTENIRILQPKVTHDNEWVVLVDANDREIGVMEKIEAHRQNLLHRAFSVFVFNQRGELLLQRRALQKYHSGGLWTNTCCSHPRPGESIEEAATRRLLEEMGFECPVYDTFSFLYQCDMGNGLYEHEFDHVLFGEFNGIPAPDTTEVMDWKFSSMDEIERRMHSNPEEFTEWFKICFCQVMDHFNNINNRAAG